MKQQKNTETPVYAGDIIFVQHGILISFRTALALSIPDPAGMGLTNATGMRDKNENRREIPIY